MRRSKFRRPCKVLIFNGARVLVAIVNEDASKIFGDGNFEVEGNLNYNPNAADAIIQMANDEFYSSDFAKIHQVIDMLFGLGFFYRQMR